MMNSSERHVYVGELNLYTFRNLFPNHAPKAQPLFDQLKVHFDAKQLSTYVYSTKSLSLRSFDLTEPGFAKLLFWLVDPSILDPDYADQTKGTKRTAKRGANEEPVLSAHVVVDLSKAHDTKRSYPMAIESVDNLPRSLIILYLNKCFDSHFAVNKKRTSKKDTKVFKPHCKFVAPYSHTLEGVLAKGGALKGVKLVQEGVVSQSFGDKTYPVLENRDVQMKVQNMPRGQAAKTMLEDIWNGQKITYLKKMKVTIEDEFDNIKTLDIDLRKNDILSNFFLKKALITGFTKPLSLCEDVLRNDVTQKMKKALKP